MKDIKRAKRLSFVGLLTIMSLFQLLFYFVVIKIGNNAVSLAVINYLIFILSIIALYRAVFTDVQSKSSFS